MFKYTVIHHSVTPPGTGKRLTDYHLVLDPVSSSRVEIYEHKKPWQVTNHAVGRANSSCYSICLVGNYEKNEVPEHLYHFLVQAIAVKIRNFEISNNIWGHVHIGKSLGYVTQCPGRNMIALLPALRSSVSKYL